MPFQANARKVIHTTTRGNALARLQISASRVPRSTKNMSSVTVLYRYHSQCQKCLKCVSCSRCNRATLAARVDTSLKCCFKLNTAMLEPQNARRDQEPPPEGSSMYTHGRKWQVSVRTLQTAGRVPRCQNQIL